MKKYKRVLIFALIFFIAGFLVYEALVTQLPDLWVALRSGSEEDIELFLMDSDRMVGSIFLCLLQFIQVVSIVIPSAPIQVAGGMVYGAIRGYLICQTTYVLANVAIIVAVRKFAGIGELLGNSNKEKIQKAVEFINQGDPFVNIILLCMIPLIPNGLIPYAASAMDIRIKDFAKAVLIGSCYPILSMVLTGKYILMGNYAIAAVLVIMNVVAVVVLFLKRKHLSKFIETINEKKQRFA